MILSQSTEFSVRFDEGATYTYIGFAAPGTSESTAAWKIKRITNADTTILYADGDVNMDNNWNDRASLVYI